MRSLQLLRAGAVFAFVSALWLGGCGVGSPSGGTGTVRVQLVDGPGLEFQQVNLDIQRVELGVDAEGWQTLSTPNRTVDLLTLRGGVAETLVDGATVPAGHYGQLRLILGERNTLMLADGSTVPLTVPSGMQTGVKLVVDFVVEAGTTKDLFIDFDAHRSIQVHSAGHSDKYILRPTVRAYDLVVTGSISGRIAAADTGAGLAGAVVMAETFDAAGQATIARTTVAGADGRYTLDLLPVGGTYWVVTQPVVGGKTWVGAASSAIALSAAAPLGAWSMALPPAPAVGSISGTVTATAEEHVDTVSLMRSFATDGVERGFIVASSMVATVDGAGSYRFDGVPVGDYVVVLSRVMIGADGAALATLDFRSNATVTVGQVLALISGR